jgi:hypothetical protein
MRRNLLTVAVSAVLATVLAATMVGAGPAGAQTGAACTTDRVSATINAPSLPGGGWSVTDACVDARSYFVGTYLDKYPYAIGIAPVTYDDGHVGRLAFLSIRLTATNSVTVIGMEDPATRQLRFAGSVEDSTVGPAGATVAGQAISFPPLEMATVRLDFTDVSAPLPDWATTTTTTTTLPSVPGLEVPTTVIGDTTLPGSTTSVPATVPGASSTTTVPATTVPATAVPSP